MRTGIFGGTFNPVHLGHLLVADDIRNRLSLDRILFIPAARPPHKRGPLAPFEHRLAMLNLALRDWPGFEVCTLEAQRPGLSYTVDTLRELHSTCRDSLYLIVGYDQYREMAVWHEPKVLSRLARLIVVSRPGFDRPALFPGHEIRRVKFVETIAVDVSAAVIRSRLAQGRSVRYLLPVPVLAYAKRYRLYN